MSISRPPGQTRQYHLSPSAFFSRPTEQVDVGEANLKRQNKKKVKHLLHQSIHFSMLTPTHSLRARRAGTGKNSHTSRKKRLNPLFNLQAHLQALQPLPPLTRFPSTTSAVIWFTRLIVKAQNHSGLSPSPHR